MSRKARFSVLMAALTSFCAVMASTACAVTWHNTGNTAYTATGGALTLSTVNGSITCNGADVTGTSPILTTTNNLASLTAKMTGCTVFFPVNMHCNIKLTGISQPVSGGTVNGVGHVHCDVTIPSVGQSCTVTGSVAGSYTNSTSSNPGKLHLPHSSGVTVSGSSCQISGAGTLTTQAWTVTNGTGGTGTTGPRFTRTA